MMHDHTGITTGEAAGSADEAAGPADGPRSVEELRRATAAEADGRLQGGQS
ncbi:hypothetical protein [Streptomyces sioyaensis]|uniref:hypothetical protein n=1 Tax=Streptomyces sioyaensis TaxID=67364 RepID=UPI003D728EAA